MKHLKMGNPQDFSVHVGPVIDQDALKRLKKHKKKLDEMGRLIYQSPDHKEAKKGTFFAPVVYEINSVNDITEEVFGPILHIVRYQRDQLDQVIEQVNQSGFGLTLGIHSRIDSFTSYVIEKTKVGNNYINRNMIGAVVGVQPFGGMLCSGSGPKAGGPNYVRRLCKEKTVTINTAAVGGNVDLITI
jgi:RHH-type proline utilization regulon transcriptional repressor/proline dehydrogenase/delta 1-pyrroline-5-carboxylate dehydrogenase